MTANNGLLLLDKPRGVTSHDVVARVRKALNEQRVGHAGTLDPMATGLLVLAVGPSTRLLRFAQSETKRYSGVVTFGVATDSLDADGEVLERREPPALSLERSTTRREQCSATSNRRRRWSPRSRSTGAVCTRSPEMASRWSDLSAISRLTRSPSHLSRRRVSGPLTSPVRWGRTCVSFSWTSRHDLARSAT